MELQDNFDQEVLEASNEQAVLVDFWAPWCGPCQVLGPVLEQVHAKRGDFKLVKVNVDDHQHLAREYGVRGIPQVNLFVEGRSIQQFSGAMSAHQLEAWLDEYIPSEEKNTWTALSDQLDSLDPEERIKRLENFISQYPENKQAAIALARNLIIEQPEAASQLLNGIKIGDPEYDEVQYMRKLSEAKLKKDPVVNSFFEIKEKMGTIKALQSLNELLLTAPQDKKQDMISTIVAIYKWLNSNEESVKKQRKIFEMYSS